MNIRRFLLINLLFALPIMTFFTANAQPPVAHPRVGVSASSDDGSVSIKLIAQKHNFGSAHDGTVVDTDIYSPKSVNVHPNGKKYYVNSLEGCVTIAYEMGTNKKLKVIQHKFDSSHASLWAPQSKFFEFKHYTKNNTFSGKPVESTFSHNGRYLWVPYYHRSYDINSQDPSAVAVIDTKTDNIIRLFETGPLPKMIRTSHKGNQIAISHWGDNTIGLIDASSENPKDWHYKNLFIVDHQLQLNFSKTSVVNRDMGSGYELRGTVFSPDDHYLFVSCMGGNGGIAIVDLQKQKYMGHVYGMLPNIRHMLIKDNWLYLSINSAGVIQRIHLDEFIRDIQGLDSLKSLNVKNWESCKVLPGARTIEISPSGKYVFAACNSASRIAIMDTRTMKMIASIPCDSYPVGLDISHDGRYLIATSQGRKGVGGNAVNIYEVTYKESEAPYVEPIDTIQTDSASTKINNSEEGGRLSKYVDKCSKVASQSPLLFIYLPILLIVLIIGIIIAIKKLKK